MLTDRSTQQGDLQKALADANSLVITAQTRPERAQAEISNSQSRIQQINATLKAGRDAGKTLSAEQRDQLNAELAALNALIHCGARSWPATANCRTWATVSTTC